MRFKTDVVIEFVEGVYDTLINVSHDDINTPGSIRCYAQGTKEGRRRREFVALFMNEPGEWIATDTGMYKVLKRNWSAEYEKYCQWGASLDSQVKPVSFGEWFEIMSLLKTLRDAEFEISTDDVLEGAFAIHSLLWPFRAKLTSLNCFYPLA
jgi:hypothetical protein